MRKQKLHLRNWVHWEKIGKHIKIVETLCGIASNITPTQKLITSQSEAEELMQEDKARICKNCWNSYTSINSQQRREKILED
jgi:hypothetical protein